MKIPVAKVGSIYIRLMDTKTGDIADVGVLYDRHVFDYYNQKTSWAVGKVFSK